MDQELDLRAFLTAIARRWKLILLFVLLAGVVGALVAFLSTPEYRATATVAIAKPRFLLTFDESIRSQARTGDRDLPLGVVDTDAYTILAMNGDLKTNVLKELGWQIHVDDLNKHIKVEGDSGVIQFTGKDSDPEKAAQIASTWARLYANQLNKAFSSTTPNIPVLEQQLSETGSVLSSAENALADFQARSRIEALQQQFGATSQALRERYDLTYRLGLLKADVLSLRGRLGSRESAAATAANQFQALILETLAVSPQSGPSLQTMFNLDSAALASMTASELIQYLDTFAQALDKRIAEAGGEIKTLPGQIAAIKKDLTVQEMELARLLFARDVAKDTYQSISRKLEESRLQVAMEEPEVKMVSEAAVPSEPVWPKPALVLVMALLGGLVLGVLAAVATEFVRRV